MQDHTDGCGEQYHCSIAYYFLKLFAVTKIITIDRSVDTPGHGSGVLDGYNYRLKGFLPKKNEFP